MAGTFVVVAGTDTGVGKTFVGRALAVALRSAGRTVTAIKPVETGCDGDVSPGEDGALLAEAAGQSEPRAALLRLRTPVAAPVAADAENASIDLGALVARAAALGARSDVALVEGAGGLLSPLSWDGDLTDVARALGARVLVVGSDRLGVVNHVLLTLGALGAAKLEPLGVVLSAPETPDASTGTNASAILRAAGGRLAAGLGGRIVQVPRAAAPEAAAPSLAPVVSWIFP